MGYAHTSTEEDDLASQMEMLKQAGYQRIFVDEIQDHQFEQPALTAALAAMHAEDTLIIG